MDSYADPQRIHRVVLACIQCRSRHVKCDSTQPICNRCNRDGKECTYQKSKRGGLDKAALAQRRLRLQQEAERTQQDKSSQGTSNGHGSDDSMHSSPFVDDGLYGGSSIDTTPRRSRPSPLAFQVSSDRLLTLYFENFNPSLPIVLPFHYLQARSLHGNHGMGELLLVLQWIGSIYAPWTPSEPYYEAALTALSSASLAKAPFNVQALMIFAIAQYHCDMRDEAHEKLEQAVAIALELRMNEKSFAQAYGEASPVLEESWRRTYYMLSIANQHFAVVTNTPIYTLLTVPNLVDLPCDDEFYESGQIPPIATWQEYDNRSFADVEIIYSSIVYLYDMTKIVANLLDMLLATGIFGETLINTCDAKVAIWSSLLPACKKDPLRRNGEVDEVMFTAHMIAAIILSTLHRPFSSLSYHPQELSTSSFLSPTPFVVPLKSSRTASHTARALKAVEIHTKLLAIPCAALEKHDVFTMTMSAQLAAVQISACANLLEDFALQVARDRVRLSIGFLNAMGSVWPLGKKMAREVRGIARAGLLDGGKRGIGGERGVGGGEEIEVPRDELIWPVDPAVHIDIYSGIEIPMDLEAMSVSYSSSNTSNLL